MDIITDQLLILMGVKMLSIICMVLTAHLRKLNEDNKLMTVLK